MIFKLPRIRRSGVTDEELSAYVDGSLDAAARTAIEERLSRSPEERARLDALQATVAALKSADRVAATRSFALTPAMAYGPARPVRGRDISPLMPAMAAAAAALAVGLLLVGNVTGALRQSGEVAAGGAEMSAARQQELGSVTAESEGSRPMMDGPTMAAEAPDQGTMTPAPLATVAGAPPAPAGPQSVAALAPTEVATPLAAERAVGPAEVGETLAASSDATVPADSGPGEGAAKMTVDTAVPGDEVPAPGTTEAAPEPGVALPLWQLEIALGALAVVLGATALGVMLQRRG